MSKLLVLVSTLALLVAAPALAQEAQTPPSPAVGMASGLLVDLSNGKVLWSKDAESQRPPASLTKILTALIVLERSKLDDRVVITPDARAAPGSRMFAETGWTFSVHDLLWGLMLQSGNDAAISLAHKVAPDGTVEGFVKLMNER